MFIDRSDWPDRETADEDFDEFDDEPSLNFCLVDASNDSMPDTELLKVSPSNGHAHKDLDAESLFSAELAGITLLTRDEEETLGREIVRARRRVRSILRRARRLSRAALADTGRGVVAPERDFREREAIAILRYAEQLLRVPRTVSASGLTRRELKAFMADLSSALADYRALRDRMVRANVRLVAMLARRYRHPTLTFLDLFQEGTMGLIRAVEKYEPERKVKFSTYASWWIWQQLGRTADTQGSLIRTPVHWNQLRRRATRTLPESFDGRESSGARDELADREGLDPARFDAMTQGFRFVSTDATGDNEDDRPLESILPGNAVDPEQHVLDVALGEHLETALKRLPPREGFIVRQRFGLGNDESRTLEEISAHLGVSRERVRQLENRALARLRDICDAAGLREYLH